MTATQQQKRMTLGSATRSVAMRIWQGGGVCVTARRDSADAGGLGRAQGAATEAGGSLEGARGCPQRGLGRKGKAVSGMGRYMKRLATRHPQGLRAASPGALSGGARRGPGGSAAHVVLVEEGQVADDAHPDEQGGGAQEDAADVIAGQVLGAEQTSPMCLHTFLGGLQPRLGMVGGDWGQGGTGTRAGRGPDPPWPRCQSS